MTQATGSGQVEVVGVTKRFGETVDVGNVQHRICLQENLVPLFRPTRLAGEHHEDWRANLQTLIIDEGFGSQDGRGRERLVEAITSIQEDFKRILVITHIQELKDLFPVQIEITKTDAGSIWEVN